MIVFLSRDVKVKLHCMVWETPGRIATLSEYVRAQVTDQYLR